MDDDVRFDAVTRYNGRHEMQACIPLAEVPALGLTLTLRPHDHRPAPATDQASPARSAPRSPDYAECSPSRGVSWFVSIDEASERVDLWPVHRNGAERHRVSALRATLRRGQRPEDIDDECPSLCGGPVVVRITEECVSGNGALTLRDEAGKRHPQAQWIDIWRAQH
jgi:hypothetical protein